MTGAKNPVENRELWEKLHTLLEKRRKIGKLSWQHVPGHSGVAGNERCDEIATAFAREEDPELFEGDLGDYAVDVLNISIDEEAEKKRSDSKSRARQKAYSYLSLVNGVAKCHSTWAECEKRVKGKPGVKYKKSLSEEDERKILLSWGVGL
jgi:ribonuclease HI